MTKRSRSKQKANRERNILLQAKNACLGKIQHKSMLAAEYVLSRMSGKDSHLLEIYRCRFCKFYHIGHNKPKAPAIKKGNLEENKK